MAYKMPDYKLEAGCMVRLADGSVAASEVVCVTPDGIVITRAGWSIGAASIQRAKPVALACVVTFPARPEIGDYVCFTPARYRHRTGVIAGMPNGDSPYWQVAKGNWLGHYSRDDFTIIAKASHAREMMEGS